ncbi:MAG: hypothetical protein ACLTM8_00315 [Veillonella parvula]
MEEGGELSKRVEFDEFVDNSFAEKAVSEVGDQNNKNSDEFYFHHCFFISLKADSISFIIHGGSFISSASLRVSQ